MTFKSVEDSGFAEWYVSVHPRLVNSLLLLSGDIDGAAEAADEALARALARWRRVAAMSNRDGWVYRVAVNIIRRRARHSARERQLATRAAGCAGMVPPPADEVWAIVGALAPRQREVVVWRYVADLDESQIAGIMGVSRSTVSSALTQAHRQLAAMLAKDEESDRG